MEKVEPVTTGDLCDEAEDIYVDLVERHHLISEGKITKKQAKRIHFIHRTLAEIRNIQALALYAALVQIMGKASHHPITFNKRALLEYQDPYLDTILGEHPSRYIYGFIHALRRKVEVEVTTW